HRSDAITAHLEHLKNFLIFYISRLNAEQTRDYLHVVLHAVMNLFQQHLFLFKRSFDPLFGLHSLGNVLPYAYYQAVRKAEIGPHRIDYATVANPRFEIPPFVFAVQNEIANHLTILRVRVTFRY